MYIIDESYFTDKFRIPNTSEIDVSGSTDSFQHWIDREARLCLQDALGNVLFAEFDSYIVNGVIDPGAPQKWLDLVNGKTYTYQSKQYTWKGLSFTEGVYKGSLLTPFVYCKWLEFQLSKQSGMGEIRGSAANAMSGNSTHRYVSIWNSFVDMYQGQYCKTHTYQSYSYFKGIPFFDYYGEYDEGYVSFLTFLEQNESDYPEPQLKEYGYLNTFGL